ncbi:MAG: serine/threonine protein kinase, partial [Polyangiaceae bacterium]
ISKAHAAGVVHRDLKPDNIFLVKNDDEQIVKVLDFGIAKARFQHGVEDTTRTGAILGTPHYMSPEQLRGDKALDHRADIWALGIIAYECVTQAKPFVSQTFPDLVIKICSENPPPPSSRVALPPQFDAWFAKSTSRDPAQRFESVREQVGALRAIAEPHFDAARASATGERDDSAAEPAAIDVAGETGLAASAVSEVALNTQHATYNTRPVALTNRKPSRSWLWAVGALVVGAIGVGVAGVGTKLGPEPPAGSSDTPDVAVSVATPGASPTDETSAPSSAAALVPSASDDDPQSSSPPTPAVKPSELATATPKASTAKATAATSTGQKPTPNSAVPKASAAKPVATATGQVDLGI